METFKRKIWDKFKAWKEESDGHTALLVEGARRIGKSTAVEEFAKDGFIFDGWKVGDGYFTSDDVVTDNVVLLASWVEAPYYVGSFKGANLDHSNVGYKNASTSSS